MQTLLEVAFSRWHVEKWFERAKQECGLGAFEVRTYQSLIRHWRACRLAIFFLATQTCRLRKKNPPITFEQVADATNALAWKLWQIGLDQVISSSPQSKNHKLVIAMIIARIINPRSKLATVRSLNQETCSSVLGDLLNIPDIINENDLYHAMSVHLILKVSVAL